MSGGFGRCVADKIRVMFVCDDADFLSGEEGAADVFELPDVFDGHVVFFGEGVEGQFAGHVGGGGDNGFASGDGSHFTSQIVGAAQMTGQEADGVLSALVHDDDAGIAGLVDQQRGQNADDDAGGHDADQIVVFVKGFPEGSFKVCFVVEVAGMGGGQPAGQLLSFAGEIKVCGGHGVPPQSSERNFCLI